jgi:hypothetical protein
MNTLGPSRAFIPFYHDDIIGHGQPEYDVAVLRKSMSLKKLIPTALRDRRIDKT